MHCRRCLLQKERSFFPGLRCWPYILHTYRLTRRCAIYPNTCNQRLCPVLACAPHGRISRLSIVVHTSTHPHQCDISAYPSTLLLFGSWRKRHLPPPWRLAVSAVFRFRGIILEPQRLSMVSAAERSGHGASPGAPVGTLPSTIATYCQGIHVRHALHSDCCVARRAIHSNATRSRRRPNNPTPHTTKKKRRTLHSLLLHLHHYYRSFSV